MNWPVIRLKNVTRLIAGGTPDVSDPRNWADSDSEGHAWVSIADMSNRSVVESTARRISSSGLRSARLKVAPPGTLIFSMYASLGHTALLSEPATWNQAILGIVPRRPDVNMKFVQYSLESIRSRLIEQARSNTQDNLNAEQVRNLSLQFPPLEEQRRIADFLDAETARIDRLANLRSKQVPLLRQRLQSMIMERISRSGPEWVELRRLGVAVTTGPFGTALSASEYVTGGIPVINPTHIKDSAIQASDNESVSEAVARRLRRHRLSKGDLVIGRKGDIGRSALVSSLQDNWICGSDSIALSLSRAKILPTYVSHLLSLDVIREQLLSRSVAATMPSLNEGNLLSLRVPFMHIQDQRRLAAAFDLLRSETRRISEAMSRQLDLLAEHRQALITAAVTGQLDVTTARSGVRV